MESRSILQGTIVVLLYLFFVILGVVFLATAQFRASTGSTYDSWRLSFRSNRLLKKDLEEQLEKVQMEKKLNWERLKWDERCFDLFDSSGKLDPSVEKRTRSDFDDFRIGLKQLNCQPGEENCRALEGESWCVATGITNIKYNIDLENQQEKDFMEKIQYLGTLLTANEAENSDLVRAHQDFLALNELEKCAVKSNENVKSNKIILGTMTPTPTPTLTPPTPTPTQTSVQCKVTKLLIVIPYDLLILFLVMSMGTLGGMSRLLRDYHVADQKTPTPTLKDYLLVPLIGAIVAIGGYILAKTGLLLLSSTKGETSLSPFMVGLVGIVSGLLAREVIGRIEEYGRNALTSPPTPPTETPPTPPTETPPTPPTETPPTPSP